MNKTKNINLSSAIIFSKQRPLIVLASKLSKKIQEGFI